MAMYPISREAANGGYIYYYAVSSSQNTDNISREAVNIGGITYEYSHTEIIDVYVANAEKVTELVEILSESKEVTDITALLEQTILYNKDGYSGILTLSLESLALEDGEQKTSYFTVTQSRDYPGLSSNDSSLVPKTLEYNYKTYTLTALTWTSQSAETVDFIQIPTSYTAHAVYSANSSSTQTLDYNVTAK